jgi:GTP-binding protein
VAVVGRPNVGKSTLFNRLLGREAAIVHDRPGVTRDRHYGDTAAYGRPYTLVDTGGFDPLGDDVMKKGIAHQVEVAVAEADVVVCVLDATEPPVGADSEELALLRRSDKPVIYVANKCDSPRLENESLQLYRFGLDRIFCVSGLHGRGVGELEEAIVEALGPAPEDQREDEPTELIRVAVVGRPNAGKSSLVNRLLGEERLLVDDRPGTTRDAIDTIVERGGRSFVFVDTAGLRKRARVAAAEDTVEALSVMQAIRAVDRAEIVVVLADATQNVSDQDAKILSLAADRGRGIVVGLNKIDLLDQKKQKDAVRQAKEAIVFAPWAPVTTLSAKTGRGVDKLLAKVVATRANFDQRVKTAQLNRFFETVLEAHPPPTHAGKAPRLYYVTQASIRPPTFVVKASHPQAVPASYRRYVMNAIRKQFGFEGVPLRVAYKQR